VLITERTRNELGEAEGYELIERGTKRLKNIAAPVRLHRAIGAGEAPLELKIDPVCRMAVDPERAAATRRRVGVTYFFCSRECAAAFSVSPRRYTATSAAGRAARGGFLINLAAFLIVGTAHLVGWIADQDGRHGVPPMLILFIAWGALLAFHFRMVRRVL
jgi:YHS domain-containing protein